MRRYYSKQLMRGYLMLQSHFLSVVLVTLIGFSPMLHGRSWTQAKTNRTIEAEFVRVSGDNVVLKLESGSTVAVPIASLVEADQTFIKSTPKESLGIYPVASGDWPIWRGPTRNGIAELGQTPPVKFSESENLIWKSPIPGRGHSAPMIQGDRLYLTTADLDQDTQSALCYDVETGKKIWETVVLKGKIDGLKIHKKNTHASPTVGVSKDQLFTVFFSKDGVYLIALDLNGNVLWKKNTGQFPSLWDFGYGASPVLFDDLVVVSSDGRGSGYLAAYNQKTGEEVWRTIRKNQDSSYATPILAEIQGEPQILLSGNKKTAGYNPRTGKEIWGVEGGVQVMASTVCWQDDIVYTSGGYPGKETWAIDVNQGKTLWTNKAHCYEQSLLIVEDNIYAITENGIIYCIDLATGGTNWRDRLPSGSECASPVLAGGYIYHANEKGDVVVVKPNPEKLELVQHNTVGDEIFATPTIVRNRIFIRSATYQGEKRSETLYCFGK